MTEHDIETETNTHLRELLKERDERIAELEKFVEQLEKTIDDLTDELTEKDFSPHD